jgi:hypothetical protein
LRKLTWSHPRLIDIALEEAERLIDRAEANVRRAVHDDAHPDRALQVSIYVLSHHRAAPERGWSRSSSTAGPSYDDQPPQTIKVCWLGDSLDILRLCQRRRRKECGRFLRRLRQQISEMLMRRTPGGFIDADVRDCDRGRCRW